MILKITKFTKQHFFLKKTKNPRKLKLKKKNQKQPRTHYQLELQTQDKQLSTPTRTGVLNSPSDHMLSSVSNR